MRVSRRLLAYVILIVTTVTVREAYVIYENLYNTPLAQNAELERAAVSIAKNGTIENIYSDNSGTSAHVSPLYPILLAGVYRLFRWDPVARRISQESVAIIGTTIGIALLPKVATAAGLARVAGWAAASFVAIFPFNLWIESCGCWEQPYVALVLNSLLIAFCQLANVRWLDRKKVVATGVLLGVGALLNPSVLLTGCLMAASEIISQKTARKEVGRAAASMVFIACILLIPWTLRNFYVFGTFIPFRSNFGLELAIGNNPTANGRTLLTSADGVQHSSHPYSNPSELAQLLALGEPEYMRRKQEEALSWMQAHPVKTLQLTVQRFRLFWFPSANMWDLAPSNSSVKAAVFVLITIIAFLALIRLAAEKHSRTGLLLAAVIGPSLIYLITHVDVRYRYPVFGLTVLLAFHLLFTVAQKISLKRY